MNRINNRNIWVCLLLVAATLAVYWQVQNFDFVNFDDNTYVYDNSHVQNGLTFENITWAFTATHASNWHPLTWLSHMLDCQLYGMNSGQHHLTNLLFHIANTLLLFFVLTKMTGSLWRSAFVAALFAFHPLHVESVAWVSERKDVLSTFFWLLTIYSYSLYVEHPAVNRYLLVVLCFTLGLMSKPMLVTLPFVLLLLDLWPLNRFSLEQPDRSNNAQQRSTALGLVLEKIPLFVLAAMSSAVTFYAQKQAQAIVPLEAIPFKVRTANALVSYANYIAKMIWPSNLAARYPHPGMHSGLKIAGACLLLAAVSLGVIRVIKHRPYFTVGWLWYLGTLVPVIGLVQVGGQAMADRYTYVPHIGLFIVIAWGAPELAAQWRHRKILLAVLAIALLSILTAVTWKQAGYWKNSITLFEHTLAVTSNNWLAHNNLGAALSAQGRMDEAMGHYLEAVRIKPDYVDAHNNLGKAFYKKGRTKEAISHYLQALRKKPDDAGTNYNLGNAFYRQGRAEEAIDHYLQALRIESDNADLHINLGAALTKQGRTDEAMKHYLAALRIKPDHVDAHYNLGAAFFAKGDIKGAIDHFSKVLKINPDDLYAKNNLKKLLLMQQQKP